MGHRFNLDGVASNLFEIRTYVHASRSICEKYEVVLGDFSNKPYSFGFYSGSLQAEVDTRLLEVAIRMRMLLDVLKAFDQNDFDLSDYLQSSVSGICLGTVEKGKFKVNLRECYNKLIHADKIEYDWTENDDFTWWNGAIFLCGTHGISQWLFRLDVESFVTATERLLEHLIDEVDWSHFMKYGY